MTKLDPDQLAELVREMKGDPWLAADHLAALFPDADYPAKNGVKNKLYADLDALRRDVSAQLGEELALNTLRVYRGTAIAWPADIRISAATFNAHAAMRGRADRADKIVAYAERAIKREGSVKLSYRQAARYRSEENPKRKPDKSQAQKVADAIRRAPRKLILGGIITDRDDWWNAKVVTDDERAMLLATLEAFADEVRKPRPILTAVPA